MELSIHDMVLPDLLNIYLACPYSHESLEIMTQRVADATKVAAYLMEQKHNVFSPLTHSHYVADHLPDEIRRDHLFWLPRDFHWLRHSDILYVLRLDGWGNSKGVQAEIEYASTKHIPIKFVGMDTFFAEFNQ